jgi:hypothetical protein
LAELNLNPTHGQIDDLAARLPIHGVLAVTSGKNVKFLQDSFFHYLLGQRLGTNLIRRDADSVAGILRKGELPPVVVQWAIWKVRSAETETRDAISWLVGAAPAWKEQGGVPANIGQIIGRAAHLDRIEGITVQGARRSEGYVQAKCDSFSVLFG